MKTKIFALFAAMMLLVGTTAMAQSDNTKTSKTTETEIKGDVNNDGVVDVADIAAVIAVMHEQGTVAPQYYWYVGQTEPTANNYTTLATQVTNYPSTIEYTTTSRNYVYFLIADNKSITKVMNGSLAANVSETTSPIAGYKLYKSNAGIASGITLTIYIE